MRSLFARRLDSWEDLLLNGTILWPYHGLRLNFARDHFPKIFILGLSFFIMPTEQDFFTFVYKRQLIWYKRFRLKEKGPWTQDLVLRNFKIINMYRELDRCTFYILQKLQPVNDRGALLLNIIFYRFFNLDQTYENLGIEPFSSLDPALREKLCLKMAALKKMGPIFNNAYLIAPSGKGVKHEQVLEGISSLNIPFLVTQLDAAQTPEQSFQVLLQIPLVGPFLACEIWTDLTYFHFFLQEWTDNDFVNIGPGAKWGLQILYGKLLKKELEKKLEYLYKKQEEYLPTIHIQLHENYSWKDIAYENAYSHYPFLSITNIEGALCEFRKYTRLSQGKGRRRYYQP